MTETVGQMIREELKGIIDAAVEAAVEQKLIEILGNPDERLEICDAA